MLPLWINIRHTALTPEALATLARQLAGNAEDIAIALDGTEVWLKGLDDLPIDRVLDAIREQTGDALIVGRPKIEYREAPTREVESEGRHTSSDPPAFAHVWLHIRPTPPGSGVFFLSKLLPGVLPDEYLPAIEAGARAALLRGPLAGYSVTDLEVAVIDGSYHAKDSSHSAFQRASFSACSMALARAKLVLLEPIIAVSVRAPSECIPRIVVDLRARRGTITALSSARNETVLEATVPLSETFGYRTSLGTATQRRATYSVRFSHYAPGPGGGGSDDAPAATAVRPS